MLFVMVLLFRRGRVSARSARLIARTSIGASRRTALAARAHASAIGRTRAIILRPSRRRLRIVSAAGATRLRERERRQRHGKSDC